MGTCENRRVPTTLASQAAPGCNLCHGSMSQDETRISEEEARALWHRAAELQAEAARRLEERSRLLAPQGRPSDTAEVEGYRLADVRAAAEEAGISPAFVDHALVEARNRALAEGGQARPSRMAARFLGQPPRALEVSRVIHAPAEEVYRAMQRILPERPFHLSLVDQHGGGPLDGGVLVFNVPAYSYSTTPGDQSFAYEMAWVDLKQLLFSLRRVDTDPPETELTVRGSWVHSHKLNLWVGGGFSALVASLSGCRWRVCRRGRGRRPRARGYRGRCGGTGLPCRWSGSRRAGDAGLARVVSLRVASRGEGDRQPARLDSRRHRDRRRLLNPAVLRSLGDTMRDGRSSIRVPDSRRSRPTDYANRPPRRSVADEAPDALA